MVWEVAVRESIPAIVALAGVSGSGKTYSALMLAAGLAGEGGKVGMIDTEAGRGAMYADDPDIIAAMPGGVYYRIELTPPFTPAKFLEAMQSASSAGITALVTDSITHEWEGTGGCADIAENNKMGGNPNWAKAKMEHKRLMNFMTQSRMHIIPCLRAREKTKHEKDEKGKLQIVQLGIQPIQEKNFMFEMTASFLIDEETHFPIVKKSFPNPLGQIFRNLKRPLTKADGIAIRQWCEGGTATNTTLREWKQKARDASMLGREALGQFWISLEAEKRQKLMDAFGAEMMKELQFNAEEADESAVAQSTGDESPPAFD